MNEQEIFEAAAALPVAERAACLDSACAGRPDVRAAVEQLLASLEDGAFMQRAADCTLTPEVAAERARLTPEAVGDQIGCYTLRERLGEGGFGTVWVAEQERPVRRRVALKIIKLGMDTKEVIARFEQERQALAMMDHPNIAKVLDAGATSFGRPYFVMELVRGIRITKYCDQSNLPTVERLKLFTAVCHAVQHAHQKGIIHRDLKPSNILATLHDGVPVPKVIDFGVAKATQQQRLTDLTIYTHFEQMVGTPLYMSPEQAEMSGLDIDTRSDIYSLGVLLYELLVGHTPFDPGSLMKSGIDEMRRVIREQEPPKPSTFVGTLALDRRTDVAKHRQTEGAKLAGQLRGDLDWIVMKALEKDRSRRYETANGLAEDIQRHLHDEPVQARPPTALYRFQRMVRRNKFAFGTSAAVLAALLAGLSVSTWMFLKEKAARERALASEKEQERWGQIAESEQAASMIEAAKSSQIAEFVRDLVQSLGPSHLLGESSHRLRKFLDRTATRMDTDLKEQPKVKMEMLNILGQVYHLLGEYPRAEAMTREWLVTSGKQLGDDNPEVATLLSNLARTLQAQGKTSEAESVLREALAMETKVFGVESTPSANLLEIQADILVDQGKSADAEARFREVLTMKQKTHGDDHPSVAGALARLGSLIIAKNPVEAEALLRKALAIQREQLGQEHFFVFTSLNDLTYALEAQNKLAESESVYREALEIIRKQPGDGPRYIDSILNNFGENLRAQGKLAEAEVILREALASSRRLHGAEHLSTASPLGNLALVLNEQGKLEEADALLLEAVAMRRKLLGAEDPTVVQTLRNLAINRDVMGRWAEAEAIHREVLAIGRKIHGDEHPEVASSLSHVALVLSKQAKRTEAEAMFREALVLSRKLSGHENPIAAQSLHHLGILCREQDRLPEAEAMIREAFELRKKLHGHDHWLVAESLSQFAHLHEKEGNLTEAVTKLREAVAVQRKSAGAGHLTVAIYRKQMIDLMVRAGRREEAESILREELAAQRQLLGDGHPGAFTPLLELADLLAPSDRSAEAKVLHREALEKWRSMAADTPGKLEAVTVPLADALWRHGDYAEAEPVCREMLDGRRRLLGPSDPKTVSAAAFLGRLLADRVWSERGSRSERRKPNPENGKRAQEAEQLLRDCLAALLQGPQAVHWRTDDLRSRLGGALIAVAATDASLRREARLAKLQEAESLLLESHERLMKDAKAVATSQRDSFTRIVRLYEAWKKEAKASEWRQRLADLDKAETPLEPRRNHPTQ